MRRSLFDSILKLNKDKNRQRAVKALCLVLVTAVLFSFWQSGTYGIATILTNAKDAGQTESSTNKNADNDPAPVPAVSIPDYQPGGLKASSWIGRSRKASKKVLTKSGRQTRSAPDSDVELDDYITSIAGSGTTKIDDHHYLTTLEIYFTLDPDLVEAVTNSEYQFVFDLPSEVLIPEDLTNNGPYYAYKIDTYPPEVAFTYNFLPLGDDTCRIVINYDDSFAQSAFESGSEFINNVLRCRCYINMNGDSNEGGLDITFTDSQSLFIPPEEINENYDISTHKTGTFTGDGKLRYEVTVSSVNGTPDTVDLTDTFMYSGDGTVSPPDTVSVVMHNADGTIETYEISAQGHITSPAQNQYDITLTLPQLDDNEYYTLVYEYAVTGLTDDDAGVSAYNSIEAHSSDDHDTTSDSTEFFIYNQQRKKLGKDGIPYGEYVQWHISVNERGSDIAGKVVYDDGFADAQNETINGTNGIVVQKGWADAVPGVDYEFVYDGNGDITGIRFLPADGSTPNNNTYHVTYYTFPDVAYGETAIVHNDAEFDGDSVSYDVVTTGGDFDKTSDGDESIGNDLHMMDWTVTVEIPVGGILSGTPFTDTLSPEGHYMTQAQYNALVTALETAWGTGVSVTPEYTGNDITGYSFTVGTEGNGYLFDDGVVDEIVWHYQTTGDMNGNHAQTFVNTFSDGRKTLPVNNIVSPNVKKLNARKISDWQTVFTEEPTDLSLDYDDEDKTFVWIAQITPAPGLQKYRVTDTLPAGVELLGVKVIPSPLTSWNYSMENTNNNLTIAADGTISGEIGQLWSTRTIASGQVSTGEYGRQTVDITLVPNNPANGSDLFNNTFNVIYYCQLAEDAWPQNGTVHLELNNTVSVEADDQNYGQADNQINIDATNMEDVVTKVGHWDKNTHLISYSVEINEFAENLLTTANGVLDPDELHFTDILSYVSRMGTGSGEAVLSLNSVLLEKEENGVWTPLTDIHWTAHTETDPDDPSIKHAYIEMNVPDETHLRLTYSYHVNCSMSEGITLANSARLEGFTEEPGETSHHFEIEDFDTSGESTYEEFCLIKIDQENGNPLSGAVFTAYCWDAVNNEWDPVGKAYTTDEDGKIIIRASDEYDNGTRIYQKDTAYCIMETTAPVGYILPDEPRPFYFWFSEHADAPQDAPADFMQSAADISTSSYRIMAENLCGYVNTGVFGIRLLPSFVALLAAGGGTFLYAWMVIKKKKRYAADA